MVICISIGTWTTFSTCTVLAKNLGNSCLCCAGHQLRCPAVLIPAAACSVSKRVAAYAVPVVVLSVAVNIPKWFETRVVITWSHDAVTAENVTEYSFDTTELRCPTYGIQYLNIKDLNIPNITIKFFGPLDWKSFIHDMRS